MKKTALGFIALILASCSATQTAKTTDKKKPLFEILTQQSQGGADIRFFEILSESKEIAMLQNDENLKRKVKADDINTSNFVILNMGEKSSGGYSITVESAQETADKVILTVKETVPEEGAMTTSEMTYPYTIVKVNSKKAIEIK